MPKTAGVVGSTVARTPTAVLLNLLQVLARYLVRPVEACTCAPRHMCMRLVRCFELFFAIFAVVLWALISAWGPLPNCHTKSLCWDCKECRGAPLRRPTLRRELVHGRDPNMAFLREERSRLSPFPADRSLSLNSLASMLAKVSFEDEGRRDIYSGDCIISEFGPQ